MSLQEADNPFDGGPEGQPGAEDPAAAAPQEKPFNIYGLRNNEPRIPPSEVGRELEMEAEWWQHHMVGFLKQMEGSEGVEAWMNHAMGLILLTQTLLEPESSASGRSRETGETETGGEEEVFHGPQ